MSMFCQREGRARNDGGSIQDGGSRVREREIGGGGVAREALT